MVLRSCYVTILTYITEGFLFYPHSLSLSLFSVFISLLFLFISVKLFFCPSVSLSHKKRQNRGQEKVSTNEIEMSQTKSAAPSLKQIWGNPIKEFKS